MFPAASLPATPTAHLYDLVATSDGIHVSPNCLDGHVLVMELIERLGLAHPVQAGGLDAGMTEREPKSDWNGPLVPLLVRPPARSTTAPSVPARPTVPAPPREWSNTAPISTAGASPSSPVPAPPSPAALESAPTVDILACRRPLSAMVALDLANLAGGAKKATPATRDRDYILTMLLDVVGDKPIGEITPDDANAMADVLASWPRNRAHYPDLAGLPARRVAAITKKKNLPAIQASTQRKHIMGLNAFFNWCVKLGAIRENPFHYVRPSRYKELVPKKRDIFSAQNLQSLFAPKHLENYTEPHKYWAPLIALFTGMRVNEVAQLYVDDIQVDTEVDEEGVEHTIPYFDITPFRKGQSIKTGYSLRRMPVPARLLELGFERYVADVQAAGSAHLFPGLAWEEGGPGRTVSRWFNAHHLRRTCGITSSKKSLHCFRHTLTTRCERAHVPKSIIQTINGHSDGQGVDLRSYVARGSLLECKRALEGLRYPELELVPYASERFAAYLGQVAAHVAHGKRAEAAGLPKIIRKGRRPKFKPLRDSPT